MAGLEPASSPMREMLYRLSYMATPQGLCYCSATSPLRTIRDSLQLVDTRFDLSCGYYSLPLLGLLRNAGEEDPGEEGDSEFHHSPLKYF